MAGANQKQGLRITVLSAALLGIYGTASANGGDHRLKCDGETCVPGNPVEGAVYSGSGTAQNWVVQGVNGAVFTLKGGSVTATGKQTRGVGSIAGSQVTLENVTVSTDAGAAPNWGGHGVQAHGDGSTLLLNSGVEITTKGQYSNGIQAEAGGVVTGQGVVINADGGSSYTFGAEAGDGGKVSLTGGSITVNGDTAAGVRAYTGHGKTRVGEVHLDGADITATGASSIGLMAGDTDGANPGTAGSISYKNGDVTAEGTAALARYGSQLQLESAKLEASGTGTGWGNMSVGLNAQDGSVVNVAGGSIAATGSAYTRGILAMTGANVTTNQTAISTQGGKSHAVHAHVDKDDTASALPVVTINGGAISTKGDESWGLYALRGGQITSSANITTEGKAGFGVFVEGNNEANARGGLITLNGGSITTTGGALASADSFIGSFGVLAKNAGNHVEINGTRVSTSGAYADGLRAEDKATIRATNATVTVSGGTTVGGSANGHGVAARSGSSIELIGGSVTTKGEGFGIVSTGAGSRIVANNTAVTSEKGRFGAMAIDGGSIEMVGGSVVNASTAADSRGATAQGVGSVFKATNTQFQVAGEGNPDTAVRAIYAYDQGKVILEGGSILTTGGGGAQGIRADNAIAEARNVSITTLGNKSYGVYANDRGTASLAQMSISTSGQTAHGVFLGDRSAATLSNSIVSTRGDYASGVAAESSAPSVPGGTLVVSNSQIRTSGANAHGVALNGGSTLAMTGGSIQATGSGSAGVYLLNQSSATLNGVNVVAAGPSLQSYISGPDRSQTITIGSGSTLMQNNGTLLQVTRGTNQAQTTNGADGKVTLNLQNGSHVSGNIRNYDTDGKLTSSALTVVNVEQGAQWAGIMVDDKTQIIEQDEGPRTDFSTGAGESVIIEGGSTPHVFNGNTQIGGGSSIGPNQQVVFNGPTTIGQNLVGQQGSGTIVGGPATIGGSVTGGRNAFFVFGGPATIGQGLQGAGGASFSFAGGANIGQSVSGQDGASFHFSQTQSTTIGGDIELTGGSAVGGGSQGAPITVAGNANVNNGSVLGGNLNIRGDLRMAGAQLAPGNSIGTVVVNSVKQLMNSTYVAEVNGRGQADRIVVQTGNVDLSGLNLRVGQENGNGGYLLNHDYTIVQAEAGNIVNQFASTGLDGSLAGTLVKLDPVKYGAKATQVSLSLDAAKVSGARSGLTGNQPAVFDGALSVAGKNASADAVMLMGGAEQRRQALDQLSGELHASTSAALYGASRLLGSTVSKRMAGNLGAGKVAGAPTAQASGAVAGSLPGSAAYPLWAEVVGNWNTLDARDNAAKTQSDTAGIYIGADTAVGGGWRVGAALGFTDGRVKASGVDSRADVRSYTAALYGGNSWAAGKGQVNLLAGAGYTRHEIDSRRRIDVGGSQTLKADYDANSTQLFAELGYAMPVGQASVLEPYAGLAWFSHRSKSFNESGGAAALHGQSQRDRITTFTLGLRGKTALEFSGKQARLSAGLGWRHAGGDVEAKRTLSFIQGNGAAFTVAGSPVAKNAAVVDVGAELDLGKRAAMGLSYSGQFGNGNTDNTGSLYLKLRF